MKKMMIMMVVIAVAAMTQAATVTWQTTGLRAPNGDGTFSGTALNGGVAYLFYGAQAANLGDLIEAETFAPAAASGIRSTVGYQFTKLTTSTGGIVQSGIGGTPGYSGEAVTLYMVVFNAGTIAASDFYMISSDFTQNFTTLNVTYNFNTRLPTSWTAVPEPTSMALLALGVAAIGLRRKFIK